MDEPLSLQQVSASVHAVVDKRLVSNVAAVVFEEFVVIVDAGKNLPLAKVLRDTVEARFGLPVRYVCATHYHADHIVGLGAFSDVAAVGSTILARKLGQLPDWVRAELGDSPPVRPSLTFDDRVAITCGDKSLQLAYCGGHTDCSIYGYLAEEKVVLTGDLVVTGEFPFPGDASVDPEVWIATVESWIGMDIEHVVPGHGLVGGPEVLVSQLELLQTLRHNTLAAIKAGKHHTQIEIPDTPPVADGHSWFVDRFRERWHAYYLARS